jgi:hypothetical protein
VSEERALSPLHWLVGPHPWAKRHLRALLWVLLALTWAAGAALTLLAAFGPFHDGCTGPAVTQCAEGVISANFFGAIVLIAAVGATVAMVWTAEERRLNRGREAADLRERRNANTAELERELRIGEDA